MIALLAAHTGAHVASHAAPAVVLFFRPAAEFFRRVLRMPWRKLAVPAVFQAAGTATPPDGLRVLGGRMLSEVRAEREHDLLSDAELAALRPRKVLGRADGDIVIGQDNSITVRPVNGRLPGDLPRRKPMVNRQPWQTAEQPVYGQAPVADVLAAEQEGREVA